MVVSVHNDDRIINYVLLQMHGIMGKIKYALIKLE